MTTPPPEYRLRVYIAWDDGIYTEVEQVRKVSYTIGRSTVNDQVTAGVGSIDVIDDGRYQRQNTAGPLYGKILPGRDVYVELEVNGDAFPVFTGQLSVIGTSIPLGGLNVCQFEMADALDYLRLKEVRVDVMEDAPASPDAIDAILDEAGWPALLRDLDPSRAELAKVWFYRAKANEALLAVAKNTLGGNVFVSQDGLVTFRDHTWRSSQASAMILTAGQAIDTALRREDFADRVRYRRAGLDVATGATPLYQLSPTGRAIVPGETHPDNDWSYQYGVAGKSVTQPEPYVDYTFNSIADGSGTDKTLQAEIVSWDNFGGGGRVIWRNLDASEIYCTAYRVMGQAVRRSNDERTIEVVAASPVVSGKDISADFEFQDDARRIRSFAHWRAATANSGQTRLQVPTIPQDSEQLAQMAALWFGSRVTLTMPGQYIEGDYFVERIKVDWPMSSALPPSFQFSLYPADMVGGNFFRISGPGELYSLIGGSDRIAP